MVIESIHSRRTLALALSLALALVAGSSLWHHDHERALLHQAPADSRLSAPSLDSHQDDYCPICLSHRLLTHSWIQAAAEAAAPVTSAHDFAQPALMPAGGSIDSPEARAPPC